MSGLTPLKAIRAKCIDCTCGSATEIRDCSIESCPLYEFRFGHNPSRKGAGNKNPHEDTLDAKKRA